MVEDALAVSVGYLRRRDLEGSARLIEHDQEINAKRLEMVTGKMSELS